MPRRQVWDIKGMSVEELRDLIGRCNAEEQRLKAPHKKARNGWLKLPGEAQDELQRRGQSQQELTRWPVAPRAGFEPAAYSLGGRRT